MTLRKNHSVGVKKQNCLKSAAAKFSMKQKANLADKFFASSRADFFSHFLNSLDFLFLFHQGKRKLADEVSIIHSQASFRFVRTQTEATIFNFLTPKNKF